MKAPVVALVGAGLSTASGIPDYRGPQGLWRRFDPEEFHVSRFRADPARFWDRRVELHRALRLQEAQPNEGHHVLTRAVRDGRIETIITQNVDGLHHKAGTPEDRLIEVHGNGTRCVCLSCGAKEPTASVLGRHTLGTAPRHTCGGLLKPDVVLFGEPVTAMPRAEAAAADAATLVAIGTSLQVWPVTSLAAHAVQRGADLIVMNGEETPFDRYACRVVRGDVVAGLAELFGEA